MTLLTKDVLHGSRASADVGFMFDACGVLLNFGALLLGVLNVELNSKCLNWGDYRCSSRMFCFEESWSGL